MVSSPIIVRPFTAPGELEAYSLLATQAFSPDPSLANARYRQRFVTTSPEYRPEQLRGAFRDGELLGGYTIYERMLRAGTAHLLTGCIGAVVTHPAHRHRGVATALMYDAIDYSLSHHHSLLLLNGIAKFYARFGYTDVIDESFHDIDRAAVLAQSPGNYSVRLASEDDVETILALYNRHYGPYTGCFTRTREWQAHWLRYRASESPLLLALDPDGHPQGYLYLAGTTDPSLAQELTANTWHAALALLQHHAHLLDGPAAPDALRYRLPPTSPILHMVHNHLEVPDTSQWKRPLEGWAVRSVTYHHRNAGWMARLVHLPTLARAMLPEWQARWRRTLSHWLGDVSLLVGEEVCVLLIDGSELRLADQSTNAAYSLHLTHQAFMQLVFGYRPVANVLQQSGQPIKEDLVSVLEVLFPSDHAWIPRSDGF